MVPLEVYTVIKNYVIPFLKRCHKSESIFSFRLGFIVAIKYASHILRASFLLGALQMTFQGKV